MNLDFAALRGLGLLLGPFEGSIFASGLSPDLIADVQWSAVLGQFPVIATITGISLLGTGHFGRRRYRLTVNAAHFAGI